MRAIENEVASIFHRIIAFVIDYIIIINTIVVLICICLLEKLLNFSINIYIQDVVVASIIMFFLIFVTYFSILDSNLYQGSMGKKYMNICVVNGDGNCLSVKKSFFRNIGKLTMVFFTWIFIDIFKSKKKSSL